MPPPRLPQRETAPCSSLLSPDRTSPSSPIGSSASVAPAARIRCSSSPRTTRPSTASMPPGQDTPSSCPPRPMPRPPTNSDLRGSSTSPRAVHGTCCRSLSSGTASCTTTSTWCGLPTRSLTSSRITTCTLWTIWLL
uniref:Uncharacterized protein n=1 Tax=Zea mays TaxID=4577 RepID=B4FKG9_MAIZE|nr:unknown [Zea mays]